MSAALDKYRLILATAASTISHSGDDVLDGCKSDIYSASQVAISSIDSGVSDPLNADSIFQAALDAYSKSLGDGKSGITGDFSAKLKVLLDRVNEDVKTKSSRVTGFSANESDLITQASTEYSDSVSASVKKISAEFSDYISSCSNRVQSKLGASAYTALGSRVKLFLETSKVSITAAKNTVLSASDISVASSSFFTSVQEVYSVFNTSISTIRFVGSAPVGSQYDSTYVIKSAYQDLQNLVSSATSEILAAYGLSDVSGRSARARAASVVFSFKTKISAHLDSLDASMSLAFNTFSIGFGDVDKLVDDYLVANPPNLYLDTDYLADRWSSVKTGVNDLVSTFLSDRSKLFYSSSDALFNAFNTSVNTELSAFSADLGLALTGLPDSGPSATDASENVSLFVGKLSHYTQDISDKYRSQVSNLVSSVRSHSIDKFNTFRLSYPRLRLIGVTVPPKLDPKSSTPVEFKFDVSNLGNSVWQGNFGVKFVDNYKNQYKYYDKSYLVTILPGEIEHVVVSVPLKTVVGDGRIGSSAKFYLICATYSDHMVISDVSGGQVA
jgi:hypothetical protein